jgi:peptidoglycan/LPS O-acetylase OafA/YrhL
MVRRSRPKGYRGSNLLFEREQGVKSERLSYRPDIDGLRAIAVIAVVAFHVFPASAPGGFVGVDIFFVISGFLISSIIFEAINADRFSFAKFYARRILRIFPALLTVLAFCLLIGWLFLPPYLLVDLGRESIAGTLFGANILFWNEAGYFDAEAASKPLLHLWSLGVEEQFYLLWPAALYLCSRSRWRGFIVILLVGTASYFLNRHYVRSNPVATFYLPQYRFWELMLGALYAHPLMQEISREVAKKYANILSVVGIAMIGYAILALDGHQVFSGRNALPPTVGAALVIASGSAWINRSILSQRAVVFVGKISYPLYLWHWPLLYFYRFTGWNFAFGEVSVIGLSFVLSVATYIFIEKPLRRRKTDWRPLLKTSTGFVIAMAAVAFFCAGIVAYRGIPDRVIISLSSLPPVQAELEARLMRVYEMRYDYGFGASTVTSPAFATRRRRPWNCSSRMDASSRSFPGVQTFSSLEIRTRLHCRSD